MRSWFVVALLGLASLAAAAEEPAPPPPIAPARVLVPQPDGTWIEVDVRAIQDRPPPLTRPGPLERQDPIERARAAERRQREQEKR